MRDIGLQRGVVQLQEHNTNWKDLFEKEKKSLVEHFPNRILEISHGGSTAIPCIPAKPIIDIFAIVPSLQVAENMRAELEELSYHYRGEEGVPERVLYAKGKEENRTHHLHLVERDSGEWKNHLLIKSYYLRHPEVANEYAELKMALAEKYPNDRGAYGKGKNEFVKSVIEKAKDEESTDILGVDIGGVVLDFIPYLHKDIDFLEIPEIEGAIDSIAELNSSRFKNRVHIVSRYTGEGPAKVLGWLRNKDFFTRTGIPEENFHPCALRHEKAPICVDLGITHFIDDQIEVLSHMVGKVPNLYLFGDAEHKPDFGETYQHVLMVPTWPQVLMELEK
ncbi:GrpB family protein [Patescibacteria group bacterium]|nr:GrpB family protein [Patescibacteria group bacterium]